MVRFASSVTSVSWIPPALVSGLLRLPFAVGLTHYDRPPPDVLGDLAAWRDKAMFRFANHHSAWIEVEHGVVTQAGYSGGGLIGRTGLGPGKLVSVPAIAFPDLQRAPEPVPGGMRFEQTSGGQPPLLAPRRVATSSRWSLRPPIVWTTMRLTILVDGTSTFEVVGASPFPRHWVYDGNGVLVQKVGVTDFEEWYHRASVAERSPWGGAEHIAPVTPAESPLERMLSHRIMQARPRPELRSLPRGAELVHQGDAGTEVFLLLDGILEVEVDGVCHAEVGPGVVVGERAGLDAGGRRTATLRAGTPVTVAVAAPGTLDRSALEALAAGHRREQPATVREHPQAG